MEAFQLLSRGGAQFSKDRFQPAFQSLKTSPSKQSTSSESHPDLPLALNFFKYAQVEQGKRKSVEKDFEVSSKKRRLDAGQEDHEEVSPPPMHRHRIKMKGLNVPSQADTFGEMKERYDIPPQLLSNLSKCGYSHPTSIQSSGMPVLFESRDLAAISPTGTGKTLSYLFPILSKLGYPLSASQDPTKKGVRALILAPTRELAHQIHNECLRLTQGRKWRIVLFSKATANSLANKAVRDKVDIIISTPLRLISSYQGGKLELNSIQHLVLDEADRLLDREFLPQVQEILGACSSSGIQKAVFSATLPAEIEKLALKILHNPIRVVIGMKDTPLPLISQSLTYVADDPSKLPSLLAYLLQPYNPPVLVFTSSQPRATSLAEELVLNGISNVDCLHAGLTRKEREDTVSRMRQGQSWVLVSTEVLARGMDFQGVREVINYDFPTSVQSYIHRIGRTGRAGREGKAVTFFTDEDGPYLKTIANVILQSGFTVPDWILKLPKPSKMKRKQMGKVKRPDVVNAVRRVGRRDAIKLRDMIKGSQCRQIRQTDLKTFAENP
ncbi:hypothetical protein K443DRAFT_676097 [Laccaria amethystina LaAM-08-1]|uniref:RNA helicase n=1 Tax=Laccaria amethystina LaAM-08-1 TaxID=1095629 RepID=A0A0C9XRN7_9AGAR|nr:hypothetical protein K443DRAFT_676097 [Laccaria amethystina LaAM-08-1]